MLPFAEDETIEALERNITAAGSVTDMLAKGMSVADISEQLLKGLGGSDTGFQLTPRCVQGQGRLLLGWRGGVAADLDGHRCSSEAATSPAPVPSALLSAAAVPASPRLSTAAWSRWRCRCWLLLLPRSLAASARCFPARRYGPCEPQDLQDRMKQAVALLGADEVRSIMEEQGKIEVTCDFCRQTYQFAEDEVLAYL